jgi:hypothetical protein
MWGAATRARLADIPDGPGRQVEVLPQHETKHEVRRDIALAITGLQKSGGAVGFFGVKDGDIELR